MKVNWANFYFRSVCMKVVALRMNLYQEVALSFKKVGDPWFYVCLQQSILFSRECWYESTSRMAIKRLQGRHDFDSNVNYNEYNNAPASNWRKRQLQKTCLVFARCGDSPPCVRDGEQRQNITPQLNSQCWMEFWLLKWSWIRKTSAPKLATS